MATQNLPWWHSERLRCALMRTAHGRFINSFAEKCYGATVDCADVAVRFFGVTRGRIDVCPLGVDTELFRPNNGERGSRDRIALRRRLGFSDSEIICVYSGRFTEDKNPLLLAKAVAQLVHRGEAFRGLFVGDGIQAEAIQAQPGCVTHPFVPVQELGDFFRAAEIGVWPTQESTSMLDAAACGLPIVVNDTLLAKERIAGNGITYRLNDLEDLVRALLSLRDANARKNLGDAGATRMANQFSWAAIAQRRMQDYEAALSGRN
jgi:glycosyltransferase involved in cell wall biosynthesis